MSSLRLEQNQKLEHDEELVLLGFPKGPDEFRSRQKNYKLAKLSFSNEHTSSILGKVFLCIFLRTVCAKCFEER